MRPVCLRLVQIALALNLPPVGVGGVPGTSFDLFPLQPGLQYRYEYRSGGSNSDELCSATSSDSGVIAYLVVDSTTIADSLVVWSVQETREIFVRVHVWCVEQSDTSYTLLDTNNFKLYESNRGRHEIKCFAVAWQFPIVYPDTIRVYRFSDTSAYTIARGWYKSPIDKGTDTIWFCAESGLYARHLKSNTVRGYMYLYDQYDIQAIGAPTLAVSTEEANPTSITLWQNYPNPFNPATTIVYELPRETFVSLKLYNCLGQQVMTLDNGIRSRGRHSVVLLNHTLSTGAYFCVLRSGTQTLAKKILLVR